MRASTQRRGGATTGRLSQLRREAGGLLIRGIFEGGARLAALHPAADLERHGVRRLRDLPYRGGGDPAHTLDVFIPPGEGPHPVMLYIHGGGFRILSKDTHWSLALGHALQGFVVFNINYRLTPAHAFPAPVEDAMDALLWIFAHAQDYQADPDLGLVFAGESAGANLALCLTIASCMRRPEPRAQAIFERDRAPDTLLAIYGMLETGRIARHWQQRPLSTLVRDRMEGISTLYRRDLDALPHPERELADPLLIIESDAPTDRPLPPTFAPVGTRDPIIDDTLRLEDALRRRDTPCLAPLYPGGLHGFHALRWRPDAARCWADMEHFLSAYGPGIPQR